jgi:hypothetical protein
VPTLVDVIAGERVRGSWWPHPKARDIFRVLSAIADSPAVVRCRLVDGKVTFVHQRLWPALVRCADRLPRRALAAIEEIHTPTGAHRVVTTPFPRWVPDDLRLAGERLSLDEALAELESALGQEQRPPRQKNGKARMARKGR